MSVGEWELTPQQEQDTQAQRGNGRCFWFGCVGPGWKPNPSMLNTPALRDNPFYYLCSKHHAEATERNLAAMDAWDRLNAPKGKWEAPRGSTPRKRRLAEIMREKKIAEAQDLRERDSARRAWAKPKS